MGREQPNSATERTKQAITILLNQLAQAIAGKVKAKAKGPQAHRYLSP